MKENLHEGFSLSKVEIHEMINFTDKDTTKIQNDTLFILFDIYFYIILINEIISVYKIYKDGITLITYNFHHYILFIVSLFVWHLHSKIFNSSTSLLIFILYLKNGLKLYWSCKIHYNKSCNSCNFKRKVCIWSGCKYLHNFSYYKYFVDN